MPAPHFPDLIEFKYDETWLVNAAYQVAFKHEIYLVGQDSSIGVPNGALPVYLVALVVRLTRDLVWISALFVVANLAALVLAYLLVDRYIGRIAAIVMALLYAVSPWTVYFSRKIWIPDLTPFFVVLFWWAAYKLIVDRRAWYLELMWVWAACILQAHLSGVLFPELIILLLVIFPRRVRLLPLLAGILGYGLIFSSYIWWIYLHGNTITRLVQEFGGHGSVIDGTAAQYGLYLLTGQGIEGLTGESYASYLAERLDFSFLNLLEYAVFGLGFVMLMVRVVRALPGRMLWNDRDAQSAFLLLVWAAAPIVFFTRHSTPTMLHYMLILLPSQFIVTGYAVQKLLCRLWPYRSRISAQAALAGLVVLVLAWGIAQAYTSLFTYQYIGRTSVASTFGIPYRYYTQAIQRAGNRVVILSHLDYPAIEYLSGYAPALRPYDDRSVLPVPVRVPYICCCPVRRRRDS